MYFFNIFNHLFNPVTSEKRVLAGELLSLFRNGSAVKATSHWRPSMHHPPALTSHSPILCSYAVHLYRFLSPHTRLSPCQAHPACTLVVHQRRCREGQTSTAPTKPEETTLVQPDSCSHHSELHSELKCLNDTTITALTAAVTPAVTPDVTPALTPAVTPALTSA